MSFRWHHNKTAIEVLLLRFFVVFGSILYNYMYNCFDTDRQECMTELFYIITRVASVSCGKEKWTEVYNFLVEIGISIPEDFHLEMSYVDSMLDVVPGEEICN